MYVQRFRCRADRVLELEVQGGFRGAGWVQGFRGAGTMRGFWGARLHGLMDRGAEGQTSEVTDKMKVLRYWISKIGSCAGAEEV